MRMNKTLIRSFLNIANFLTIHQSVPVNGIASLTLSVDVFPESDDVDDMAKQIESLKGIHYVKILARE